MGRVKGEQRGSLLVIGPKWYGRWSEWVADAEGNVEWKQVKRPLCDLADGKARAIELLNENLMRANGPAAVIQGHATVAQFVEAKFRPEHVEMRKASGRDHYDWCFGHILPALGEFKLSQVSQAVLQGFLLRKSSAGLSPQSVRHLRNALSAIWRHAKASGCWRGDLPTECLKTPEVRQAPRGRALTSVEAKLLLDHLAEPYRTLTLLILTTGLRIGEALALDWAHVDLERRLIRVRQNFTHGEWGTLKSRNSVRDLPLNEETLMALQRLYDNPQRGACKSDAVKDTGKAQKAGDDSVLLGQPCNAFNCKPGDSSSCQSVGRESAEHPANQPACGGVKDNTDPKSAGPRLVFPNAKGNPLDAHNIAARELKPACKAAGLPPIGWHTLRHTAVTLLQQAGATGAEAKAFAGHGSVGMTERYTHAEVGADAGEC